MKFELLNDKQTKLEPTVPVKVQIDAGGDVELVVDGVSICYLSSAVGKLIMYNLDTDDQQNLEKIGFKMRGREIAVG